MYYSTYSHFENPKELARGLLFNDEGVAINASSTKYASEINLLFPSYFGLVCYNHFLKTKNATSLALFWKQVNFLAENGTWEHSNYLLFYDFDYIKFELKAPWISGITQALAASLFIRAHLEQPAAQWEKMIEGCVAPMLNPVQNGGLLASTANGSPWVEEYPSNSPSLVLNGFIFCIISAFEYAAFTDRPSDVSRVSAWCESMVKNLHHYTYGQYIRHNLKHWDFSNIEYQGLNIFQFVHLYQITKQPLFRKLAHQYHQHINWDSFYNFYGIEPKRIIIEEFFNPKDL